jgi:hypothetical protein
LARSGKQEDEVSLGKEQGASSKIPLNSLTRQIAPKMGQVSGKLLRNGTSGDKDFTRRCNFQQSMFKIEGTAPVARNCQQLQ